MKKKKIQHLFCMLLSFIICQLSYAQYDYVFQKPYPGRFYLIDSIRRFDIYEKYRHNQPEAFKVINTLRKLAKQAGDKKGLLQTEIIELGYIDEKKLMDTALLEKKALAALEEAQKINYPQLVVAARILLGNYYNQSVKHYGKFFEHYLKAFDILQHLTSKEYFDRSYCIYALSLLYYKFYDYDNAIKYTRVIAADTSTEKFIQMYSHNVLGMCYVKKGIYDSARKYLRITADIALRLEGRLGKPWLSVAIGNIGHTWFEEKEYDKAVQCYDTAIAYAKETRLWPTATPLLCNMIHILLAQKNLRQAEAYVDTARYAAYKVKTDDAYLALYNALAAFYHAKNNLPLTVQYKDSSTFYRDNILKERDLNVKSHAEVQVEIERRNGIENLLKNQLEKQKWIRDSILVGSILLLLILVLLYNRQRLKSKLNKERLEYEKQKAEKELVAVNLQLQDFTNKIKEKNALLQYFEKEVHRLQTQSSVESAEEENILAEMQNAVILTDEDWDKFRRLFEKVHRGFFNRLKEAMPGITPAEIRFIVLAKLKFTNKEMANCMGISSQAVRTTWYRLRKKFDLPEEGGLEEVLARIETVSI